jgi:hypothetical protein
MNNSISGQMRLFRLYQKNALNIKKANPPQFKRVGRSQKVLVKSTIGVRDSGLSGEVELLVQ